jgi:acyl-CoA synthetase (AMP-forming)/AMP-acid ligase II
MVYNGWLGSTLLFKPTDVVMCPLPLFHVFACYPILMSMIGSGAHVVFPTPQGYRGEGVFDNFWKLIERYKVTYMITVPTALAALMQRPVNADISSLKNAFSGSSPLPIELYNRFKKETGIEIIEGYGLTEATCLVSINPPDGEKKIGSVGFMFPYTQVRILTSQGAIGFRECAVDEVGEICISNPGVFEGSTYTEADKNKELFADGRFLPDHPRRPQHRPGDHRGSPDGTRGGWVRRCNRPARRPCGRASLRLCRIGQRLHRHGRGPDVLCFRPYPRTRGAAQAPGNPAGTAQNRRGQGVQTGPAPPGDHPHLRRGPG